MFCYYFLYYFKKNCCSYFRLFSVGVAKVVIFYLITKTFMQSFIFNYLNANDLSIRKVQYNFLIINPLFLQRTYPFFQADGKDIIFISRKQKLFQLNCCCYATVSIVRISKGLSVLMLKVCASWFKGRKQNDTFIKRCRSCQDVAWPGSVVALVV